MTLTGINLCGHALLKFGGRGGYYVHVLRNLYDYPLFMTESHQVYLLENGNTELERNLHFGPNPSAVLQQMEVLLSRKLKFGILIHSFTDFVRGILRTGGMSTLGLLSISPRLQELIT